MKNDIKNNIMMFLSFVIDVLMIFCSFYTTVKISGLFYENMEVNHISVVAFVCIVIFFFFMLDLYARKEGTRESTLISVFLASAVSAVLLMLINMLFTQIKYPVVFSISLS